MTNVHEIRAALLTPHNAWPVLEVDSELEQNASLTEVAEVIAREPSVCARACPSVRLVRHTSTPIVPRCRPAQVAHVNGSDAVEMSRALAREEGIFTGTSGGGVLSCALQKAKGLPAGSTMVVMLPVRRNGTGYRGDPDRLPEGE